MRVIPVLDVQAGRVVRGVAGRRSEYWPWISPLCPSAEPVELARSFRDRFGLTTLYVADLDAIAGAPPATPLFTTLRHEGFHLWVDAGLRDAGDAVPLMEAGVDRLVAGLETVAGADALGRILPAVSGARLVFSLDLKAGKPLAASEWDAATPIELARQALALGVRSLLLLDLAHVGIGGGTGTDDLLSKLRNEDRIVELTVGGGVRDCADLDRLRDLGADNVLVASALHDGRMSAGDVAAQLAAAEK